MMRLLRNCLLLILIHTFSTFCLSALPKQMPADFYLQFHRDGGMRPDHTEFYFSRDLSHIKERRGQKEEILCFKVDPLLLKNLYTSLLENRFDRIGTRHETIYDRGGESVQVGAGRETYNKSDSGMTLIQPYWKSNWKNVLEEIKKTKHLSVDDSLKIRLSLTWKNFQEPLSLNISSENRTLSYNYHVRPSRFDEIGFYFLPGKYKLWLEFHEDKAKFHKFPIEFELDRDSKEISFQCDPEGCVRI
ncbi:hypothetical protein [Leptospira ainlahdjerensis]|jgi:hypothetical protein|uniref:hypothetical protein n=1 Tax=Leptospira ainlahdjerensis TaxID=2810033 RepID=UPI001E5E4E3C|nr:hypothetical protein [Leptospira ainlahdjerensis]